jgi:hypothetical protein
MRTDKEIRALADRLDENIRESNWQPGVDGAYAALMWGLGEGPGDWLGDLQRLMDTPQDGRRAAWIASGGDPASWPESDT